MHLNYLVLSDIGPFRHRHVFDFSTEDSRKSGFAFFAKNGRGKTTIYNAMKWALFGKVRRKSKLVNNLVVEGSNRPIVDENEKEMDNILMNYDAWQDDSPQQMSVLFIAEGEFGTLQVQRTASCSSMARRDKDFDIELSVSLNGTLFTGTAAEEEIAKVFPVELERFFFIDGEEVEAYTTMMKSSSEGIIDDIKSILRLPSLTRGIGDLKSIAEGYDNAIQADNQKQERDAKASDKARNLFGQLSVVRKHINELEGKVESLNERKSSLEEEMEGYQELRLYAEEKINIEGQLKVLEGSVRTSLETFLFEFSSAGNLILWDVLGPQYKSIAELNDTNQNRRFELESKLRNQKNLQSTIDAFTSICEECGQDVPDAAAHLSKKKEELIDLNKTIAELKSNGDVDPKALRKKMSAMEDHFMTIAGSKERLLRAHKHYVDQVKRFNDLTERLNNLSSLITEDSTSEIQDLANKIARTDQVLMKKEQELKEARFNQDELDRKYRSAKPGDNDDSTIKEIFHLRDTIGKFIVAIQDTVKSYSDKATEEVQQESSKVFKQLSNAPDAFEGIRLNKQFKARIYGTDGRPVVGASSGMEVIMTLSIIDALRTVSRLDAPVFFDTPARSLDKDHKNGMLNYFWREDRSQFLIFAHTGEFTAEEILEDDLASFNKAWELVWPEDVKGVSCIHCDSTNISHAGKGKSSCNDCDKITDSSQRQTYPKVVVLNE
jgi:DNA sulfur modification protein DndD